MTCRGRPLPSPRQAGSLYAGRVHASPLMPTLPLLLATLAAEEGQCGSGSHPVILF